MSWIPDTILQAAEESVQAERAEAAIMLLLMIVLVLVGLFVLVVAGIAIRRRRRNSSRRDQLKQHQQKHAHDPANDPWSASAKRLNVPKRPKSTDGNP